MRRSTSGGNCWPTWAPGWPRCCRYGARATTRPYATCSAALADDRPLALPAEEFEALWERTLRVLDDLAGAVVERPTAGGVGAEGVLEALSRQVLRMPPSAAS